MPIFVRTTVDISQVEHMRFGRLMQTYQTKLATHFQCWVPGYSWIGDCSMNVTNVCWYAYYVEDDESASICSQKRHVLITTDA